MVSRTVKCCGALIYSVETKRYLFLLRDRSTHAGSWGLAGGKVEAGETAAATLSRELEEELGKKILYKKILPLEQFTSKNQEFVYCTYFIAVENEFVPMLNHEHRGYSWVTLQDYPRPLHPGVWNTLNIPGVVDKIKTIEQLLEVSAIS